jgi:ABC-type glycerol-3-phosphate transport system substrate-binding protein
MKKTMAISALALMLAACGGSGSDGSSSGSTTPPVAMMDAFFAAVSALISTSPENTEPTATDAVPEPTFEQFGSTSVF